MVYRIMASGDDPVLMPQTCEYVALTGKCRIKEVEAIKVIDQLT